MILLESIFDGIRDIKDHFGRTLLQLVGIILGAGSIVATFSLSVAGKAAAMEYYRVSGGIQKIWIWDKPTGKVTLDKAAGVSLVVAINKVDLPDANPDKVRGDLATEGLQPEEWGGTTQVARVSAKLKENLERTGLVIFLYSLIFTAPVAGYSKGQKEMVGKEKEVPPTGAYAMPCWKTVLNNTTVTFGVSNIFDSEPPYAQGIEFSNSIGYPGGLYDNIGRFCYVRLVKKF